MGYVLCTLVNLWSVVGWHACIYLAQLQSIPTGVLRGRQRGWGDCMAEIPVHYISHAGLGHDGERHLLLLNSMKLYDLPFALTSGGPGTSTTLVSQIIIKTGFVEKSYGKATAMSTIFFVFIAIVSVIQLKLMKKREVE